MRLNTILYKTLLSLLAIPFTAAARMPSYLNDTLPLETRVEDALMRLTTEEKVAIIHAQSKFSSAGVPRLGIPEIWTSDGPHGIRPEVLWDEWRQAGWTNDSCTAFPALTCLAATWNPELALRYGQSIGAEARYRKKDVLLGPGVNIYRTPLNGRNFEYLGEDPFLASRMVVPYVKGVQQNGVAACVKHYALNNNETYRHQSNVIVSDRALHEIYLPAFEAAVKEGRAWAIMGAYNLYKGEHACHNSILINDILKGQWEFDGVVISDWGGVHNTEEAIRNGLDMEFGTGTDGLSTEGNMYDNYYLANPYLKLIHSGKYSTAELDDKTRRVLRLMLRTCMNRNRPFGSFATEEHGQAALAIAKEGIVLLQNRDNILPLCVDRKCNIAVIGENAVKKMTIGGGSSSLKARLEISPLEGLQKLYGKNVEINFARGYVGAKAEEFDGLVTGVEIRDTRPADELRQEAIEVARMADYVIFVGGLNKEWKQDCEGEDRIHYDLPYNQSNLIEALAEVNPNIIVVNISGNAVAMPWANKVKAIIQAWYLGSQAGNAIASVISGECNPSGKLPFSWPCVLEECGAHATNGYDFVARGDDKSIYDICYNEDIYVGYRWHDAQGIKPMFAFGHGLSYTKFKYGNAQAQTHPDGTVTVTVPISNEGQREGKEIVQLYVHDVKSSCQRPLKELKGFSKIDLKPGETSVVELTLSKRDFSFYDDNKADWVFEPGEFRLLIGASSSDIRSETSIVLNNPIQYASY